MRFAVGTDVNGLRLYLASVRCRQPSPSWGLCRQLSKGIRLLCQNIAFVHILSEEELLELKEEFARRLGAADATIQALKVRRCRGKARHPGLLASKPNHAAEASRFSRGCGVQKAFVVAARDGKATSYENIYTRHHCPRFTMALSKHQ